MRNRHGGRRPTSRKGFSQANRNGKAGFIKEKGITSHIYIDPSTPCDLKVDRIQTLGGLRGEGQGSPVLAEGDVSNQRFVPNGDE